MNNRKHKNPVAYYTALVLIILCLLAIIVPFILAGWAIIVALVSPFIIFGIPSVIIVLLLIILISSK